MDSFARLPGHSSFANKEGHEVVAYTDLHHSTLSYVAIIRCKYQVNASSRMSRYPGGLSNQLGQLLFTSGIIEFLYERVCTQSIYVKVTK